MNLLTRRKFLKYAFISGASVLTGFASPGFLQNAFSGNRKEVVLNASVTTVNVGTGKSFEAWTYNGQLPGPEIRINEGETLRAVLKNYLPERTTIHWHGLPVPNNMDGVPNITQKPVQTGQSFIYEFNATPSGTYIYHTHASYQLDQGLYGPLIIEPKKEERSYDREYILMLEAWATVNGGGPEASRMGRISPGTGMMGMMRRQPGAGEPLQEPFYDAYGINGKVFNASTPFKVRKGDKVRLRIINASSTTIFTFRIAGHSLTITHTDGRPVVPFEVDALRIGVTERYDVELHANNPGRWQIYNLRDGSLVSGWSLGTVLYDGIKSTSYNEDNLNRLRLNDYNLLEGKEEPFIKSVGRVDRTFRMILSGGMMGSPYWTINGKVYPYTDNINISDGERIRLEYLNMSMMPHPMHLHGHFFEIVGSGRSTGIRIKKDTLIIPPQMGSGAIEFIASNPGIWFHHCHNLYHMEGGMANLVRIVS